MFSDRSTFIDFADWWSVLSLYQSAVFSVLDDQTLKRATFVVAEGSVIMIKEDLKKNSVRKDVGIPIKNLDVKIINVIKKISLRLND